VAENVADELARSDGREVRLEEERELQLPFLLPEDGYSCDVVRGVPQGLAEFLAPLQHAGLCRMSTQPTSSGLWTIYMTHEPNPGVSFHFLPCPFTRPRFKIRWVTLFVLKSHAIS
jgi:afadin